MTLHTEYIPNQWYAILESSAVPAHKPVGITRLGQRLVLWRDAQRQCIAQDAACPHRGADLSLGKIDKKTGCLACPYHGFQFNSQGRCTSTPCDGPDAKIRRDLRARTHVIKEAHGLIWLWYGAEEPSPQLPWFEGRIDTEDPCRSQSNFEWDVSYTRLLEGMLDFHHLPFAHSRYMGSVGPMLDPYETTLTSDGVESHATMRHPDQLPEKGFTGELSVRFPGTLYLKLGKSTWATVCMSPVNETRSWGYISYHQSILRVPWIGRMLTKFMLFAEQRWIQPDDERMLCSSEPTHSSPRQNHFVRADAAIAMWHTHRTRAFEQPMARLRSLEDTSRIIPDDKHVACSYNAE